MTAEVKQALDAISAALGEQIDELERVRIEQIKEEAEQQRKAGALGASLIDDYASTMLLHALSLLNMAAENIDAAQF